MTTTELHRRNYPQRGHSQRVAANIKAELARAGMNQKQLARGMGISQQSLNARLKGRTGISVADLHDVAHVLNVPLSYLYDGRAPDTPARSA